MNNPLALPTFQTKNGKSWIDITICSTPLIKQSRNWEVLDKESHSDHHYIKMEFFEATRRRERHLTKMRERKLFNELRDDAWVKDTAQREIHNKHQLEIIVNQLYKK